MQPEAFGDLLADRLERVERRHRLLEHHADVARRAARHISRSLDAEEVRARRSGSRPRRVRAARQQAHDASAVIDLAGAGFADEAERLSPRATRERRRRRGSAAPWMRQAQPRRFRAPPLSARLARRGSSDVPQPVAEQVQPQHGDDDGEARDEREARREPPSGSAPRSACGPSSASAAARRGRHRTAPASARMPSENWIVACTMSEARRCWAGRARAVIAGGALAGDARGEDEIARPDAAARRRRPRERRPGR